MPPRYWFSGIHEGSRNYDHVTPLLHDLHWLRVLERIAFRLTVLVYHCQHGITPPSLANQLHRVADVESRQRLRSAATMTLVYVYCRAKYSTPRSATVQFL